MVLKLLRAALLQRAQKSFISGGLQRQDRTLALSKHPRSGSRVSCGHTGRRPGSLRLKEG